jgi:hypothetical protein
MEHLIGGRYSIIFKKKESNRLYDSIRANTKSRGSPARADAVREMKSLGYQNWKQKYSCGRRWAAETVFSAVL